MRHRVKYRLPIRFLIRAAVQLLFVFIHIIPKPQGWVESVGFFCSFWSDELEKWYIGAPSGSHRRHIVNCNIEVYKLEERLSAYIEYS